MNRGTLVPWLIVGSTLTVVVFPVIESYITHVRITEDAAHPSSPAPPSSAPENKKPRVIIVSVRRSGRVRMHKARENSDGSFSIGKTWMLDDLSAIQSYSAYVPKSPLEQQQKEWASTVGFVVTIWKPYYWHARSSKEKEFFIGSLVKIFKKYTGGKVPELIGFDEKELQMLSGAAPGTLTGPVPPGSRGAGAGPPTEVPVPATSAAGSREPSRDAARQIRRKPSEDPTLRTQKSREQMSRPSTANKPAPAPFGTPLNQPPTVAPAQREPRSKAPPATFLHTADEGVPSMEPKSLSSKPSKDGLRPTTPGSFTGEARGITASPSSSIGQRSPYREVEKAPQLDLPIRPSEDAIGADTLSAVTAAEEPKQVPPNEPDEPSPPIAVEPAVAADVVATEKSVKPSPAAPTGPRPAVPRESAEEFPDHRPGLGPMVKKKSNKDIAGAFRKAATAYGAFKPRPGGAGERLLAAAKKQQADEAGPNGITGVVPAPSHVRSPDEARKTPAEETVAAAAAATEGVMTKEAPATVSPVGTTTPTVEITQHAAEEGAQAATTEPGRERIPDSLPEISELDDRPRTPSPASQSRRRRRREDHTIKYCQALGIEPSILDGRGVDFDDILTDLGWNGRLSDEQKIEDLEADVRREIGRVEATSWLGNLEQQEGKVEQLAVLIDKTIDECDELEGLLTLYSHELNVSYTTHLSSGDRFADLMDVYRLSTMMSPTLKRSRKVCRCRLPTRNFSKTNCRIF